MRTEVSQGSNHGRWAQRACAVVLAAWLPGACERAAGQPSPTAAPPTAPTAVAGSPAVPVITAAPPAAEPVAHAEPIDPALAARSVIAVHPGDVPPVVEVPPSEVRPEAVAGHCDRGCGGTSWGSIFGIGDFLYWRARRPGLDFALNAPGGGPAPVGTVTSADWQSRAGFRTGIGYRAPDDGPGVTVLYTNLHADQSAALVAPAGGVIFATLTHPGSVSQVSTASATSSLNYNVFDLECDGRLHPGPALLVRPFVGARFARIDQGLEAVYNGIDANIDFATQHLHFEGGGLRAGCELRYALLGEVGFFGRGAASLVLGDLTATERETNNGGATVLTNVSQTYSKVVPVVDLAVGVDWHHKNFHISLGYEMTDWLGLADAPAFVDDAHQGKFTRQGGDLSLDGLTARFEYDF